MPGFEKGVVPDPETAASFAASSDGFERLWTPHRMVYIDAGKERAQKKGDGEKSSDEGCPFCSAPGGSDQDGLIVWRGERAFVVMNLFPYNTGHLLVCPYRHVADYTDLTELEREEIGQLTAKAMNVVRAVSAPAGFNLGMNQGAVAGAGVADHLHQHIIPRWFGDTNFFPLIAQTKALPELLEATREKLQAQWQEEGDDVAG